MSQVDPYAVLGVPRSATLAEVKGAYRRLVHRHHPDKNPHDPAAEEHFRSIVAAYEVLRDPSARAEYDGNAARRPRPQGYAGPRRAPRPSAPNTQVAPGGRVTVTAGVALADVLTGVVRTIHVNRDTACAVCGGSGSSGGARVACAPCRGSGRLAGAGAVSIGRPVCQTCRGTGQVPAAPCVACQGSSVVRERVELRVRIPAGARAGHVVRFAGEGHAGRFNGPRGDLFVTVEVDPHPTLVPDGVNLTTTLRLTPAQAVMGATVHVSVLDAIVKVRVRPGTQPGTVLRLRGRGLPLAAGVPLRGDCLVRFAVAVPTRLTGAQRDLYRRLADLDAGPHAGQGILRRVGRRLRRPHQ